MALECVWAGGEAGRAGETTMAGAADAVAVGVRTVQQPAREQGKRGPAGGGWTRLWLEAAPAWRPAQPGGAGLSGGRDASGSAVWCGEGKVGVGEHLFVLRF